MIQVTVLGVGEKSTRRVYFLAPAHVITVTEESGGVALVKLMTGDVLRVEGVARSIAYWVGGGK